MISVREVYKTLFSTYGPQGWWPTIGKGYKKNRTHQLTKEEKFEISIGAILAQNTNWKNAEKALKRLSEEGVLQREKLKRLTERRLAVLIRSSGYHNQKARKIKEFVNVAGPFSREKLLSVWGIGPETADSILLYAYQQPVFVVDTYTKRIFSRLGLYGENVTYGALQAMFHKDLRTDPQLFNEYHALLVEHAKQYCKKVPECKSCPLAKECSYGKARLTTAQVSAV